MLSRTLSGIRAGTPQELVAAWLRGEIAPLGLPGAPAGATPPASPSSPPAPTGPGPEAAWTAPPLPAATATAPAPFDPSSLPPLEDAFGAPAPGLATALEGEYVPADPGGPGPAFVAPTFDDLRPAASEPALDLAYEPVPAAAPGPSSPDDLLPSAPDLSTPAARPPSPSAELRPEAAAAAPRPSGRPPWLLIGGGALGLLALVGGLGFFLLGGEEAEVAAPADGKVTLQIETTPPGASLVVNDQPVSAPSPTRVETLALREHVVTATLEGHVPTTVKLPYTQAERPVRIHLEKLVEVTVTTEPPGAQVTSEGRVLLLQTPGTITLPPGEHQLLAGLEGHATASIVLKLQREPVTWETQLARAAYLMVSSRPAGAELYLDGVALGLQTPAKIAVAPRRSVVVEARREGKIGRKKLKGPKPGKQLKVDLRLVDPVAVLESRQAGLQDEVDRLGELIQSATERMETGILSDREVRQIGSSRDKLQGRQDRLIAELDKIDARLMDLRAQAELERARAAGH
ncbi:MAG: PEGA domain-containing protein [Deltaproteobacteria bacterium]|nr:PEGA domain-containing protein [Deltaproteobacteria bacterium]